MTDANSGLIDEPGTTDLPPSSASELLLLTTGFDYDSLKPDLAREAKESAGAIRLYHYHLRDSALAIGRALLTMKGKLPRGLFGKWTAAEFPDITDRTLQLYMSVAHAFGTEAEKFSGMGISIMQLIAAPKLPTEMREEFKQRHLAGEELSVEQVKRELAARLRCSNRTAERRDTENTSDASLPASDPHSGKVRAFVAGLSLDQQEQLRALFAEPNADASAVAEALKKAVRDGGVPKPPPSEREREVDPEGAGLPPNDCSGDKPTRANCNSSLTTRGALRKRASDASSESAVQTDVVERLPAVGIGHVSNTLSAASLAPIAKRDEPSPGRAGGRTLEEDLELPDFLRRI